MIGRLRDILGRIRKDVLRQVNSSATTPPKHESIELKDFDRFVDRYYNFLLTERNFAVSERGWRGNEYYVLFSKGTILIDIGLETGSIPFVSIRIKHLLVIVMILTMSTVWSGTKPCAISIRDACRASSPVTATIVRRLCSWLRMHSREERPRPIYLKGVGIMN